VAKVIFLINPPPITFFNFTKEPDLISVKIFFSGMVKGIFDILV